MLLAAIHATQRELANTLLSGHTGDNIDLNEQLEGHSGENVLFEATRCNCPVMTLHLVRANAVNLNQLGIRGTTPLLFAIDLGHTEIVSQLL